MEEKALVPIPDTFLPDICQIVRQSGVTSIAYRVIKNGNSVEYRVMGIDNYKTTIDYIL